MDRYDFASVVDDIFKGVKTTEEVCNIYVILKNDLDNLFRQNVSLLVMRKLTQEYLDRIVICPVCKQKYRQGEMIHSMQMCKHCYKKKGGER